MVKWSKTALMDRLASQNGRVHRITYEPSDQNNHVGVCMENRVYVSGRLKDELRIEQLRDYIWVRTNAREFYRRKDPHITILPGFKVSDEDLESVKRAVDVMSFENEPIQINTVGVYENIHKPYTVQLDAEHEMHDKIDRLIKTLEEYETSGLRHPDSPHITLFKTQGWWDTLPRDMKKSIQHEVMSSLMLKKTSISSVEIEVR